MKQRILWVLAALVLLGAVAFWSLTADEYLVDAYESETYDAYAGYWYDGHAELLTLSGDVIASGTFWEGGAPWRLYDNGTIVIDEGAIYAESFRRHPWWDIDSSTIERIIITGPI